MDTLVALQTRRSIRVFDEHRPVARDLVESIVDAGRLACTALNVQPWEFVVVTNKDTLRTLADGTDHGAFISKASACIVVFCQNTKYYVEDGSAATQNMLVAAHACGLGACWVAGDKKYYADRVCTLLGAPQTHKLFSMIPLGYPAQEPSPKKRSLMDVLHWERFGNKEK